MGISFATYVVLFTLIDFLGDPTVTSLDSRTEALIWNIPFPAVAVCGNNKISREALKKLIREM